MDLDNDFSEMAIADFPDSEPLNENFFNTLDQPVIIPEGYFDEVCYSIVFRNTDEIVYQGTAPSDNFLLSDIVNELESGIYWIVFEECNSNCSTRNDNTIPIPFNFIYDNVSPQLYTVNDFSSLGRDGYGHQYYYLEDFNYAYTDNIIVDGEMIYIDDQEYQIPFSMTDSIEVSKTLIVKETNGDSTVYNNNESLLPQLTNNYQFDSLSFQDLLYSFPDMLTNKNTHAELIYTVTDRAGNVSVDNLKMTVVFEAEDLVSDMYNYPNPFKTVSSNSGTTIRYMLSNDASDLRFIILDGSSKVIKEIAFDGEYKTLGTHHYYFDGRNNMGQLLGSGVYYGFLEVDGEVKNKIKMAIFNK